jgi:hypothetical protein
VTGPNHKITRTRAPGTSDYGYKNLRSFTGPVAKRSPYAVVQPPQLPQDDYGRVSDFVAGMQDSHRERAAANRRSLETAATVGLITGLAVAAYRHKHGK